MIAAHRLMRGVVGNRMEAEGGIILAAGGEMAAAVMVCILEIMEVPRFSLRDFLCDRSLAFT
jgi:hypothetical protein